MPCSRISSSASSGRAGRANTDLTIAAVLPAIVSYGQRRRRGQEAIESRDDLDYAANFLWLTFGDEPEPAVVDAFNRSMILYAEHSFNASTFTPRVIASTTADLYSAVVGAIGALKGPLHGGANEAVMHIFDEIGEASNVGPWLDAALDVLLDESGRDDMAELYDTLEREFVERKGIHPNLGYPSGPAYNLLGFDTEIFTPLFVASRVTGWTAHIMEQAASNALIRPLSAYNGVDERHVAG